MVLPYNHTHMLNTFIVGIFVKIDDCAEVTSIYLLSVVHLVGYNVILSDRSLTVFWRCVFILSSGYHQDRGSVFPQNVSKFPIRTKHLV